MIGEGALAIWFDVEAEGLDDLNAWYPQEHLPERLAVPGFLRGRRYAATGDGPAFFTLYETRDVSVLSSAPYLARLNAPTGWTRRVLPRFNPMVRNAYRLVARGERDRSARDLVTVRIKPDSGRGPYVREWLEREGATAVAAVPGVGGCALYVSDGAGTSVKTAEREIVDWRVQPATPFLALCELDGESAEPAVREFWAAWARKIAAEATVERYRLLYGLAWL